MSNDTNGNATKVKVELGGGSCPRGRPFINVDLDAGPGGLIADLETEPIPFEDDSVDELYASHFLEHIRNQRHVLREIVRVCCVGASVEIRVPHYLSSMACCAGHVCVISPEQVRHWCKDFPQMFFGGMPKRLKHLKTRQIPGEHFGEAKALHPGWSDEQVMRFVPGASHELRYYFEVINNNE